MPRFVVFKSGFGDKKSIGLNLDKIIVWLPAENEVLNDRGVGFHSGVRVFTTNDPEAEGTLLDIGWEAFCKILGATKAEELA